MMEYIVNGQTITYDAVGDRERGPDGILLDGASDLTLGTAWAGSGFVVKPLLGDDRFRDFQHAVSKILRQCWLDAGFPHAADIPLEKYHTIISDFEQHKRAIEKTKLLPVSAFPLGIEWIEKKTGEICKRDLIARNPFDGQSVFHFRVIRPSLHDNNPLHRDVWLEEYSGCINLYIPVCGSNENSSLILIPGSHQWPESRLTKTKQGALINRVKYNVPAVTDIHGDYQAIRPNPGPNELLVFSPYLVHGGAANLNADTTRISIELRLWPKP